MDVSVLNWEELIKRVGKTQVNQELDNRINKIYCELQDLATVLSSNDTLVKRLIYCRETWFPAVDQYERNVLHLAALDGNLTLARCLVYAGGLINAEDGIGQTPLTLSLHKGHVVLARWLVENGANIRNDCFPYTMPPLDIIDTKPELSILKEFFYKRLNSDAQIFRHVEEFYDTPDCNEPEETLDCEDTSVNLSRVLNINVGDQKNTVNIFGCVNRCPDVYDCHTAGGGDFHNRGYLNESIARIAGHGGFWHVTERVLKRPTVNPASFKKKFQDNNFNNNEEALLDYDEGLSIAMIKEFEDSEFFPSDDELATCLKKKRCHNEILLKTFKEWVAFNRTDAQFSYHMDILENLMPVTRWYKESVRNGNGMAIEGVWMLCPPIYAQVGKTNYRDESFTQLVNCLSKWPLAYRMMYQQNRTINLDGKEGRQLAGDEWVESYLVMPVKRYASAQTSFNMLEMMSSSVNILEMNRKMYKGRQAFDIHRTRKHHKPSSFLDQMRVAQFALGEKWFQNLKREEIKAYPWAGHECKDGETVPSKYVNAVEKGNKKAEKDYSSFLLRKFPNETC